MEQEKLIYSSNLVLLRVIFISSLTILGFLKEFIFNFLFLKQVQGKDSQLQLLKQVLESVRRGEAEEADEALEPQAERPAAAERPTKESRSTEERGRELESWVWSLGFKF